MSKSSARFLAYDLRPAKQTERLMLIDYLRCATECGFKLADYRYVGMGGNRFYDFLLLHRFAGIKQMISLERDAGMHLRASFNKPFEFIKVLGLSVDDFLASDNYAGPSIYWLDFDGPLNSEMISDILGLGVVARPNSFFFVTAIGDFSQYLLSLSDADRLLWFQAELGDIAQGLAVENVERSQAPNFVYGCVMKALKSAFATRGDGFFDAQFSVRYSDSTPMVTIGGFFGSRGSASEIAARRDVSLPSLTASANEMFRIRSLNITDRERHLFDIASTSNDRRRKEWKRLIELGFRDADVDAYKSLLRFSPRYVESIL